MTSPQGQIRKQAIERGKRTAKILELLAELEAASIAAKPVIEWQIKKLARRVDRDSFAQRKALEAILDILRQLDELQKGE